MSETLTSTDAPADQPELNADEQESLAIAEANEGEQQQLLGALQLMAEASGRRAS